MAKDLDRSVRRLANAQRRSPQRLIEEAITEYIERAELRETFRTDALAAGRHFAQTGLHLNSEDLDAWLESWSEAELSNAPACHV